MAKSEQSILPTGITGFLVRRFIRDFEETEKEEVRARYGYLNGWVSSLINLVLALIKFALGWQLVSQALIADGLHSFGDLLSSAVVVFGFLIARKPRDRKHPYGHANAELVAALIMSILLIVAGFELLKSGAMGLYAGDFQEIDPHWSTYLIVGITVLFKEWLWQFSKGLGLAIDSKTLKADAWHHRLDSLTTVLVLFSIFGSSMGWLWLDSLMGVIVSIVIIWSGIELTIESISPLLGENVPLQTIKEIRRLALKNRKVLNVHDILVHKYGRKLFISLHIEVSEKYTATQMHDVAAELQYKLQENYGGDGIVHVDPVSYDSPRYLEVYQILNRIVESQEELVEFHDLQFRQQEEKEIVFWEFSVDPEVPETMYEELKQELENRIRHEMAGSITRFSLEPGYNIPI